MSRWALVPLKARQLGKSRLAGLLDAAGRAELVDAMLGQVLAALAAAREIDHVAVVTGEPARLPAGVLTLPDAGRGLNAALGDGAAMLRALGASELLIVHADLPSVQAGDIDRFVRAGRPAGMALAADRHGSGTNALLIGEAAGFPVSGFPFAFGPHSLARHLAAARARGLSPALPRIGGLALDIDTPDDLACLSAPATGTAAFVSPSSPFLSQPTASRRTVPCLTAS